MGTDNIAWGFLAATLIQVAVTRGWPAVGAFVAAVCLKVALSYLAGRKNDAEELRTALEVRLAAIESRPDQTPRVSAVEAKLADIAEQVRQVRNITNFKGGR